MKRKMMALLLATISMSMLVACTPLSGKKEQKEILLNTEKAESTEPAELMDVTELTDATELTDISELTDVTELTDISEDTETPAAIGTEIPMMEDAKDDATDADRTSGAAAKSEQSESDKADNKNRTADSDKSSVNSQEEYPGPDVAEIVNLRGDETTVYKLADGTYMDRTDTIYTYHESEHCWYDASGVPFDEKAK